MYVTTAESRKGFPDLSHPRVGLHITNAHEPELGRVRVHITPFSVLREMGALDHMTKGVDDTTWVRKAACDCYVQD